jgi:hypothetical protein
MDFSSAAIGTNAVHKKNEQKKEGGPRIQLARNEEKDMYVCLYVCAFCVHVLDFIIELYTTMSHGYWPWPDSHKLLVVGQDLHFESYRYSHQQ